MKLFSILILASLAVLTVACKKTVSDTDKVYIRIENTTTENFSNFTLGTVQFGSIQSGDTTSYHQCKDVLPVAFANYIAVNDEHIYIADIVPTPFMKNGYYLLKVVSDFSSFRYTATFIEE